MTKILHVFVYTYMFSVKFLLIVILNSKIYIFAECKTDLAFIVDDSGSILDKGKDNFQLVRNFIGSIINMLHVGPDNTRIALLRFSDIAMIEFRLDEYSTKEQYNRALDIMVLNYQGMNTNTTGGIFKARTELFNQARGDRDNVQNVAILITDGLTTVNNLNGELFLEAESLRKVTSRFMVVGVTNDINKAELTRVADTDELYEVVEFGDLSDMERMRMLIEGTCVDISKK